MDSTTPSSPMQHLQHVQPVQSNSPTSTPTLSLSNCVQHHSIPIGTNTADSQANSTASDFVIPTLSPADWARLQQLVTSSNQPVEQPTTPISIMATPEPPKKQRGRPRKTPGPPSQKPPQKSKAKPASPPKSDAQNETTQDSQGDTQIDHDDDTDATKRRKCWFTPESDGKCDLDLIAEWCSSFENYNAWRTQQKNVLRDQVAAFLVSKGHADRGGRECEKKIGLLVQWFHDADRLRKGTGEGNQDSHVEFTVSKEDIALFKWNKRRVKKCEEDGGSLEVRILRKCPWYEELEPVLRDRPSASPLASRDSLGEQVQRSVSVMNKEELSEGPTESVLPYSWEDTPPRHQPEDDLPSSQELATPGLPSASQSNRPSRSVTPFNPPSKRLRSNTKDIPSSISTKESPDFLSALNRLPTKEDREESESRATKSQEQISLNFTKEMSNMMASNRAAELATKESIAISKMNVELRIARSKMVVDLIRGNMDPTAAEALALRSLPDVLPSRSPRPDAEGSGSGAHSHTPDID